MKINYNHMKIAKKLKLGVMFFLLPMFISSCVSVSTLPLEVMRPATYSVPPDILSVVVVDFAFPYRSDSTHIINVMGAEDVIDTIWVDDFGLRVVNAMAEELENRAFFDSVYLHPVSLNRPPVGKPNLSLSASQIRDILNKYNAHAIIALESIEYNSHFSGINTGEFLYATMDANSSDDQGYIDSKSIPSIRHAMESLANFMGKYYPDRIAPYWESQQRSYYSAGHHLFSRANDLLKVNNWEHAARVWYYVFDEGTKRQKAMAAYNIALSFEVRGDFVEAAAWAQVSEQIFMELNSFAANSVEVSRASWYLAELNKRIKESELLEDQIGAVL